MATQIKLRRDTAANWLLEDPVLGAGEPGFELVTGKLKIGDGTSLWSALDYIVAEPDGSIDLGAVDKNLLPATDNTYDLGSPAKRWRHVYAADGSIYIGDIKLSNSSGTLVVQQVTNAGDISEAPVANPGVVTTDRIINGGHEFSINASGVLQLDGSPYLGGDTALPTNSLGYLYNDGTGTLTWASGAGGGGGTSDRLINGLNEAVLNSDGSLSIGSNSVHISTNGYNTAVANANTVIYTAKVSDLGSIRVHATIEGQEVGDTTGYHTQACDMMIVRRISTLGVSTVDSVVYGVIYTSTGPLATLDAQWNALTSKIEITATPVSTTNNVFVKVYATEVVRGD